jgi:cysteine desulfurase/selenocysteine lyase
MQTTLAGTAQFDVEEIRKDFPILTEKVYGKPLVFLDNAATSQKPQVVIDTLIDYYTHYNANIHRGVYSLSQKASDAFDQVRTKIQKFINAATEREIIFTRGTTDGINLVAATFGRMQLKQGDEVLISAMEHHSNIVPWQILCEEKGALLKVIPINDAGDLLLDELDGLLTDKTKMVSIVHTSNSLGTINPIKEVIRRAHVKGIPVLVDAAQAIVHDFVDVHDLDCDFLVFSGHKMLGPTGIGCLYGKMKWLEMMPPYQGGGEMISSVSFEKTTYNEVPFKFEAGTPNIADVIGLGAAVDYYNQLDRTRALEHEQALLQYTMEKLEQIEGVRLIGTAQHKASVVSFVLEGINAMDAGLYLDTLGIAVRTGQHCTEPLMCRLGVPGTIRASFMFYNTFEEADKLIEGVKKAIQLLNPRK